MFDPPLLSDHVNLLKLVLGQHEASDPRIAELQHRIREGTSSCWLRERLDLNDAEINVVWLLAAIAADRTVRRLVNSLDATHSGDPTLDTIRRIAYGNELTLRALHELGDAGKLRSLCLIERSDGTDASPEHRQTWSLPRRMLAALLGDLSLDVALSGVATIRDVPPLDDLAICDGAEQAVRVALKSNHGVLCVSGLAGLGRCTMLLAAAHEARMRVLVIDARALSTTPLQLQNQLRALARESKILQRVPLLARLDTLEPGALEIVGSQFADRLEGMILATSDVRAPSIKWKRPMISVELTRPPSNQLGSLWLRALGQGTDSDAAYLAANYPLAPALIVRAAEAANALSGREAAITSEAVMSGIRTVLDDELGQFAHRTTVTQSWSDLVLADEQRARVCELIARIRQRQLVYETWGFAGKLGKGLGVSALFSGPPGTGKSMCAALVAKDLGLELYVVDSAKITSKWIGETEKHLAALFDAAEASHAVLLFDEADALFGKRSDIKSSNDRHSNAEIAYLLQRLESFSGVCILTSNHENAIDTAFARRLSLHLRFDLPDARERAALWQAMLPSQAPTAASLDFPSLARRYAMSGGYIRNAALRAAFLAADANTPISTMHLEQAARVEYESMGKLVSTT